MSATSILNSSNDINNGSKDSAGNGVADRDRDSFLPPPRVAIDPDLQVTSISPQYAEKMGQETQIPEELRK